MVPFLLSESPVFRFTICKPQGTALKFCNPTPDLLQSPATGNPENAIFETKKWTLRAAPGPI